MSIIKQTDTCCYIDEKDATEDYDAFCIKLMKMVEVVRNGATSCILICDWYSLFKRNIDMIRNYAAKVWIDAPSDDDDDLIYDWINFMDSCFAGYVGESLYPDLITLIDTFN